MLAALTAYLAGTPLGLAHPAALDPRLSSRPRWWWVLLAVAISSPIWIGLLQLLPLGTDLWASLAGRASYLDTLQAAGIHVPARLPLSLTPAATQAALWSAVPAVAVLLGAMVLSFQTRQRLLQLLLLLGLAQALLALVQLVQGPQSLFYFESDYAGAVLGSFNNRNHLADFLAMLLPVWFYLATGSGRRERGARLNAGAPLWLFVGFILLVIILSTQSRGGLIASAIVLLLSIALLLFDLGKRLATRYKIAIIAAFLLFCALALLAIELDSLARRFEGVRLETDATLRNTLALATLDAARSFWPWGSGLGSFEAVFPRFQPPHVTGYVNQAHNDYAQWLMEAGAAAVLVAALLLALVLLQLGSLRRAIAQQRREGRRIPPEVLQRCYAGLGALALLLHSWVEYNARIPALAITGAFLLGMFLKPLARQNDRPRSSG